MDKFFAACNLVGKDIDGWHVVRQLPKPDRSKGESGGNFSICYIVERDGAEYFMKVLDYRKCLLEAIPLGQTRSKVIARNTTEFNYEKELSNFCKEKRVSKVILYIGAGELELSDFMFGTVSYIVYEMANSNIRKFLEYSKTLEFSAKIKTLAVKFRSLRDVATGLNNLHTYNISHQDLKPSNVMAFEGESKIGDLGRSLCFDSDVKCPYQFESFHGDFTYAPPEAIFKYFLPDAKERLYQMDNYTLGSLIVFYITGVSINAIMERYLPNSMLEMRKMGILFDNVRTDLINAFQQALNDLRNEIPLDSIREDVIHIVEYLCNPIPERRGHPKNTVTTNRTSNFDLHRTISELDFALRKANLELLKY
jgi:eukaryotic-like serine/threonine-protein kinase